MRKGWDAIVLSLVITILKVIDTMKSGGCSAGATTVFDGCCHFTCNFPIYRFEHGSREINKLARELTKLVSSFDF